MAQRFAAPLRRYWGPLCIFDSYGLCGGSAWGPRLVRRRISRTREARLRDRSGLPVLAAYRDTSAQSLTLTSRLPRRSSGVLRRHSCGLSAGQLRESDGLDCRGCAQSFGQDRGHFATCSRLFQISSKTIVVEIDGSIVRR